MALHKMTPTGPVKMKKDEERQFLAEQAASDAAAQAHADLAAAQVQLHALNAQKLDAVVQAVLTGDSTQLRSLLDQIAAATDAVTAAQSRIASN